MAVVIRLKRFGRRNRPFFRICVMDSRTRRDGRALEEIGHYDPLAEGKRFDLDADRARYWLSVGAQPSETVASFLKDLGIDPVACRKGRAQAAEAEA